MSLALRPQQYERLLSGLQTIGLEVDERATEQLLDFIGLLHKWNRTYNLTAIDDPIEMVTRHLLDSLVISPFIQPPSILDVGTGAGLPGLPLAITRPADHFTLLDSNSKKTRFVQQVVSELGLANVSVVHSRMEAFTPAQGFSTVVARAVTSLSDLLGQTTHVLAKGGMLVAMKGVYPQAELEDLPAGINIITIKSLQVPGLDGERHVVVIRSEPGLKTE